MNEFNEYRYFNAAAGHTEAYLWKPVLESLSKNCSATTTATTSTSNRILDLGCGNGAFANHLHQLGYQTIGIDPSVSGIRCAKECWPQQEFHVGSAYDDLASTFGQFDAIVSLEVVEHVYAPREYIRSVFNATRPGGSVFISTPFHGYWKNLCIAISGNGNQHYNPMWDHGHIKFWSMETLTKLLLEVGFVGVKFKFAGRFYPLWKSMIVIATKPAEV